MIGCRYRYGIDIGIVQRAANISNTLRGKFPLGSSRQVFHRAAKNGGIGIGHIGQLDIPIAMHLHINDRGSPGMVEAIAADACDIFNLGAGSTHDFLGRAYVAHEAGIPVWHGSAHELGILDAAILHACAAAPACTYPSDILSCQRVHNLLATPLDVVDSCIRVPDGPGLGVELDEDALQRYAVR